LKKLDYITPNDYFKYQIPSLLIKLYTSESLIKVTNCCYHKKFWLRFNISFFTSGDDGFLPKDSCDDRESSGCSTLDPDFSGSGSGSGSGCDDEFSGKNILFFTLKIFGLLVIFDYIKHCDNIYLSKVDLWRLITING
jgi:hypothetical protein